MSPLAAQDSLSTLERFFAEFQSLEARFSQEIFDDQGESLQRSTGDVQLSRPGRFRWQYGKPFEQLILADGKKLWIYDKELEQVSVKPLSEALGNAPIMLLVEGRPLEEEFVIEDIGVSQGLNWVELQPKVRDTEFNTVQLGFDQASVREMILHDQFGQRTVIKFDDVETNPSFSDETFRFDIPPGADVIGQVD